jgi:PAS domain-containing protein
MQEKQRHNQLYRSILEAFNVFKLNYFVVEIVYDDKGRAVDLVYLDINPAAEQLIGKSKAQIIGKSRKELLGDVSDEFPERFDNVVKTGEPAHFESYGSALEKYFEVYDEKKRKPSSRNINRCH